MAQRTVMFRMLKNTSDSLGEKADRASKLVYNLTGKKIRVPKTRILNILVNKSFELTDDDILNLRGKKKR